MPVRSSINLLPKDESASLGAKLLQWALTFGRYIVILTELVVIIAFLMRFSLDQQLSDVYESIKAKQLFLDANKEFEDNFRRAQAKLLALKQTSGQQLGVVTIIKAISAIQPTDIRLINFSLAEDSFRLTAVSGSEVSLATFVKNLAALPSFINVSVSSITSTSEQKGLQFSVKGNWKKSTGKTAIQNK